jgi:hypothetical protein
MTTQAPFILRGRNPDVLSCIANLSPWAGTDRR